MKRYDETFKEVYEGLPTPVCGEKNVRHECYKCKLYSSDNIIRCGFIDALEAENLCIGVCPICGGITLEEEITSSNPGAMIECIEDNCDYRCNQFLDYQDFKRL